MVFVAARAHHARPRWPRRHRPCGNTRGLLPAWGSFCTLAGASPAHCRYKSISLCISQNMLWHCCPWQPPPTYGGGRHRPGPAWPAGGLPPMLCQCKVNAKLQKKQVVGPILRPSKTMQTHRWLQASRLGACILSRVNKSDCFRQIQQQRANAWHPTGCHSRQTALQNGPFGLAKRAIRPCKKARNGKPYGA